MVHGFSIAEGRGRHDITKGALEFIDEVGVRLLRVLPASNSQLTALRSLRLTARRIYLLRNMGADFVWTGAARLRLKRLRVGNSQCTARGIIGVVDSDCRR